MDFHEYPLLNVPDLMLVLMKEAAHGPASLRDTFRRLRRNMCFAKEDPKLPIREILKHLVEAREHLLAAGVLAPQGKGSFILTPQGREVLASHPLGVDDSVLMQLPEFRAFVREKSKRLSPADTCLAEYDKGFAAYRMGAAVEDNPYSPEISAFLAWENGWFEARDEQLEQPCGPRRQPPDKP